MGWMERENMMSVVARAMMNTSVGTSFLLLSISTRITSRLRMQLTSTVHVYTVYDMVTWSQSFKSLGIILLNIVRPKY